MQCPGRQENAASRRRLIAFFSRIELALFVRLLAHLLQLAAGFFCVFYTSFGYLVAGLIRGVNGLDCFAGFIRSILSGFDCFVAGFIRVLVTHTEDPFD